MTQLASCLECGRKNEERKHGRKEEKGSFFYSQCKYECKGKSADKVKRMENGQRRPQEKLKNRTVLNRTGK